MTRGNTPKTIRNFPAHKTRVIHNLSTAHVDKLHTCDSNAPQLVHSAIHTCVCTKGPTMFTVKTAPAARQRIPGPNRPNVHSKAAAMKTTQTRTTQPIDWQTRIGLARSILNQREPTAHTARMATAALAGANIDALTTIEKTGTEAK